MAEENINPTAEAVEEPCEAPAEPETAAEESEVQQLQKEIDRLKEELEKAKELDLRVRAEYDNYRKRTSREMGEIAAIAKADAITGILPIADNIERALAAQGGSEADIRKGVEMIRTQIENTFQKLGVEEIAEENVPFDPTFHNAVLHVEDETQETNMVVQVLQKGYKIGSRVLRYAMVKVAN